MPHRCSLSANQCWKRRGKAWMGRTACGPKTVVRQAYTLRDGSALWFAEYCAIPTASGNWIEMYLFQDAATFRQEWGRMQLLYVAVAAGGVLALGALAFALTGWAMQPARRAERMEREFLAAASHELKSPLAVIITSAELLPSGGEEAKYRANILSEAHRMAQLVQELLSLFPSGDRCPSDHAGKAGHRGLSLGSL